MFQVIDMHCDTIPALQWKEKQEHLADADLQINLDKLEKGGSLCQCFSLFTFLKGLKDETPFEHVRKLADLWKSEVERYPRRFCAYERSGHCVPFQCARRVLPSEKPFG